MSEGTPSVSGNPYRPGMGTVPTYLADRDGQLRRFRAHLADFPGLPHNVRVTGLRGVGKTVLLGEYVDAARHAGWITVTHECADAEGDGAVAVRRLHDLVREGVERLSLTRRVTDRLRVLIEQLRDLAGGVQLTYRDLGLTLPPTQGTMQADIDLRAIRAFEILGETIASTRSRGALLVLDEFQIWRDRRTRNQWPVSTLVRALAHVQRRREGAYPIMLVVGGLDPLIEHLAEAESYTERMFSSEALSNLDAPEAAKAFVEPARLTRNAVEDELVGHMVRLSGGYPFFIQFFGAYLWRAAGGPRRPLTLRTWRDSEREIRMQLDQDFFLPRYSRATRSEREFLGRIADEGESTSVERLIAAHGITNSHVQAKAASLSGKGLLYRPDRGVLAFTTPLFGDFLRRQRQP